MNRNLLYLVIGLLAAGVIVFAYMYYQESRSGVEIRIGDQGISIKGDRDRGGVTQMPGRPRGACPGSARWVCAVGLRGGSARCGRVAGAEMAPAPLARFGPSWADPCPAGADSIPRKG